jgi:hypothetical protein
MNASTRQIRAENIVATDRAQAQLAGREAALAEMARKAPHTYLVLKAASRAGTIVELLAPLAMSDVRLCAAAVALETGAELDYVMECFSRLLNAARFAA